ncbi:hypothetical protein L1049_018121 [Liquidambar formosana]|uniref:Uncharacterized protein n=1 Tax=Liquidambar formosana TaxID=63359 RepID=A0AAP0R8X5_LIQFO
MDTLRCLWLPCRLLGSFWGRRLVGMFRGLILGFGDSRGGGMMMLGRILGSGRDQYWSLWRCRRRKGDCLRLVEMVKEITFRFKCRAGFETLLSRKPADIANTMKGNMNFLSIDLNSMEFESGVLNKERAVNSLLIESNAKSLSLSMTNIDHMDGEHEVGKRIREIHDSVHTPNCLDNFLNCETDSKFPKLIKVERVIARKLDLDLNLPICQFGSSVLCEGSLIGDIDEQHRASPLEADIHDSHDCEVPMGQLYVDGGTQLEICGKEFIIDSSTAKGEMGNFGPLDKAFKSDEALLTSFELAKPVNLMTLDKDQTGKMGMQGTFPSAKHSFSQKQLTEVLWQTEGCPQE